MKNYLTLLLLFTAIAVQAQKVSLALNLKKDSTYYLRSDNAIKINEEIQGQKVDISTGIKGEIAHKVLAINDTIYTMQVRYVSMSMSVNAMGTNMVFTTDANVKEDTGPMAVMANMMNNLLRGMVNKPFTMELSKTGRVISIKNMEDLFNGMFSQMPANLTEAQKTQFRTQIEKSFGENSIKNNFQQAFPSLPTQKVAVNDQWSGTSKIEANIVAKINTTYTLKAITEKAYSVLGTGIITQEPNMQGANTALPTKFDKIGGKYTADYSFDKKTGWIITSTTDEDIEASADMNGTSIPLNMKMMTTVHN